MKTTEPRRRQVPPCLSTCNIRKIWRKRIPLMALVAKTCPFEPTDNTTIDATTTIKSMYNYFGQFSTCITVGQLLLFIFGLPIIQMGFLTNLILPQNPIYFDRHPADQRRIQYSTPKNTTKHISIQKRVSLAKSWYVSIVESTLNIRQTNTSINL